jgi:hypothetical protein
MRVRDIADLGGLSDGARDTREILRQGRAGGSPGLCDDYSVVAALIFDILRALRGGRASSMDSDVTGLELVMHDSMAFFTR